MQNQLPLYRTTKGFHQNHKTSALKCKNCKQDFLANRKTAKYCSSSCRSQYWMTKNKKKVITLAVPADIDDDFLEKIKNMLVNYKSNNTIGDDMIKAKSSTVESFTSEKELRSFMSKAGFVDYKIPKHDLGIYYDKGLTIKKLGDIWTVQITS